MLKQSWLQPRSCAGLSCRSRYPNPAAHMVCKHCVPCREQTVTLSCDTPVVQMLVVGALYGTWGERKYPGRTPTRVDALQFLLERLEELRTQIQDHRQPASDTATATAFVTFKCACCLQVV